MSDAVTMVTTLATSEDTPTHSLTVIEEAHEQLENVMMLTIRSITTECEAH